MQMSFLDRCRQIFPPFYLQPLILLGYNIVSRQVFNFERPTSVFVLGVLCGIIVHCLVGYFVYKKIGNIAISFTISFGGMLQMYSPELWPYLLIPIIGNLSKGFVRYKGRHFFNPSNFALVLMFELFPHTVVGNYSVFSSYLGVAFIFFILGTINVLYAKQATVAFSWYISFWIINYIRFLIENPTYNFAYLALNPLLILFTFHMMTDPMTTPKTRIGKILFGVTAAVLDAILRNRNFPQSNYYVLFGMCAFNPLIWEIESRWMAKKGEVPSWEKVGSKTV
jgi:enediyne biosynthesis protein E5